MPTTGHHYAPGVLTCGDTDRIISDGHAQRHVVNPDTQHTQHTTGSRMSTPVSTPHHWHLHRQGTQVETAAGLAPCQRCNTTFRKARCINLQALVSSKIIPTPISFGTTVKTGHGAPAGTSISFSQNKLAIHGKSIEQIHI